MQTLSPEPLLVNGIQPGFHHNGLTPASALVFQVSKSSAALICSHLSHLDKIRFKGNYSSTGNGLTPPPTSRQSLCPSCCLYSHRNPSGNVTPKCTSASAISPSVAPGFKPAKTSGAYRSHHTTIRFHASCIAFFPMPPLQCCLPRPYLFRPAALRTRAIVSSVTAFSNDRNPASLKPCFAASACVSSACATETVLPSVNDS